MILWKNPLALTCEDYRGSLHLAARSWLALPRAVSQSVYPITCVAERLAVCLSVCFCSSDSYTYVGLANYSIGNIFASLPAIVDDFVAVAWSLSSFLNTNLTKQWQRFPTFCFVD